MPPPAMEEEVSRNGVINLLDRDWAIGVDWYAYDLGVVSANIARFASAHKPYIQRKQEQRNIGVGNPDLGHSKLAVARRRPCQLAAWFLDCGLSFRRAGFIGWLRFCATSLLRIRLLSPNKRRGISIRR